MNKYVLEILKFCGLYVYTFFMNLILSLGGSLTYFFFMFGDVFLYVFFSRFSITVLIISVLLFYILKKKYQHGWFWRSLVLVPNILLLFLICLDLIDGIVLFILK